MRGDVHSVIEYVGSTQQPKAVRSATASSCGRRAAPLRSSLRWWRGTGEAATTAVEAAVVEAVEEAVEGAVVRAI